MPRRSAKRPLGPALRVIEDRRPANLVGIAPDARARWASTNCPRLAARLKRLHGLLLPGRADHGPGQGNGRPTAADDLGSRLSNPAWTPFTASPLCAEMGDGKQLAVVISRRRCQSFGVRGGARRCCRLNDRGHERPTAWRITWHKESAIEAAGLFRVQARLSSQPGACPITTTDLGKPASHR